MIKMPEVTVICLYVGIGIIGFVLYALFGGTFIQRGAVVDDSIRHTNQMAGCLSGGICSTLNAVVMVLSGKVGLKGNDKWLEINENPIGFGIMLVIYGGLAVICISWYIAYR